MKLHFLPLASSLAGRIVCYEANVPVTFVEVDAQTKRTSEGADYLAIHPLGLVPALELEPGDVVCETAAVLQFLSDQKPEARLAPADVRGRARLRQWLSFIGTELHKGIYTPLLETSAPAEARAYALGKAPARLDQLERHLAERDFLLDDFSIADAYLFAVLNWSAVTPVDLEPYPAIRRYQTRLKARASVARAFTEEAELYRRVKSR